MEYDYSGLPEHMRAGMRLYIEQGIAPGGFMLSVLCNDLSMAVARADGVNRARLADIATWVYNEAPSQCWGSPEKVQKWLKAFEDE